MLDLAPTIVLITKKSGNCPFRVISYKSKGHSSITNVKKTGINLKLDLFRNWYVHVFSNSHINIASPNFSIEQIMKNTI
jgi:hypothetical protein